MKLIIGLILFACCALAHSSENEQEFYDFTIIQDSNEDKDTYILLDALFKKTYTVEPDALTILAATFTPLFELRVNNGRDLYYVADPPRLKYYMNECKGCRRYINGVVASVARAPSCPAGGPKLQPVYYVVKHFVFKSEHDHVFTTDKTAAEQLVKRGYTKPIVAYYCAKTQGQCGATHALHKYSSAHLHYFTTNVEVGKKKVAAGWKDEGVLCYVWPNANVVQTP